MPDFVVEHGVEQLSRRALSSATGAAARPDPDRRRACPSLVLRAASCPCSCRRCGPARSRLHSHRCPRIEHEMIRNVHRASTPQMRGDTLHHVRVADAMEAVASNAEALSLDSCGSAYSRAWQRQRRVKRSVEDCNVRRSRIRLTRLAHGRERRRIVERREVALASRIFFEDRVVDPRWAARSARRRARCGVRRRPAAHARALRERSSCRTCATAS